MTVASGDSSCCCVQTQVASPLPIDDFHTLSACCQQVSFDPKIE